MKITHLIEKNQSDLANQSLISEIVTGLSSQPKAISSKFFYDDIGSQLFQKISQHEDYYLTKTEFEILTALSSELPNIIQSDTIDIIELGAGDGHKSKLIIDGFLKQGRKVNFYPIDISEKAMQLLGDNLNNNEALKIHGVIADYFNGLEYLNTISDQPKLVLFLGSNIGNFTPAQSQDFLKKCSQTLHHGDYALIGFDLKKSTAILNRAYNDADGLTEAFNLNVLARMNRELGANFDAAKFQHYGFYNPAIGAMESYLIALEAQTVDMPALGKSVYFEAFESLHLECSYKYSAENISTLAQQADFTICQHFVDKNQYFIDALWRVNKPSE